MNISFSKDINNYSLKSNNEARENYKCASNQSFSGLEQYANKCARGLIKHKEGLNKILSSDKFNGFLKSALENPGVNEAVIAVAVTCTARPLTIMATPGAKREDKEYAATQSITSGITGLAFAYILFNPLKKSFEKVLQKINKNGVQKTLEAVYQKDKYKDIINQLIEQKIIPDRETFAKVLADDKQNPFTYLKNFINGEYNEKGVKSAKKVIEELLKSTDSQKKVKWIELSKKFSDALSAEFKLVKNDGVKEHSKYLIHKTFEFLSEGKYNLVKSDAAGQAQNIYNFLGKFVFFPFTAAIMIWCIPKVMKFLFPNHKKGKKRDNIKMHAPEAKNIDSKNMHKRAVNFETIHATNNSVFNKIQQRPATNKQVSFSGGFNSISKTYQKVYEEPVAKLFSYIAEKLACSEFASKQMNNLMQPAYVEKYGTKVLLRNSSGKVMKKADNNFFIKNIVNIAAIWGTCFYIVNTIRNKEIEPERKPALCTNMALVALLSALASTSIDKFSKPIFDAMMKIHKTKMGDRLNYNCQNAWDLLRRIITATIAFRYLGPVLATPAADKLVKLFGKQQPIEKH
ncbi:MAG: hypothetical protein MJ180_00335 [Candidatus Gastranaerophilales bacterium]|nr:hypothetical protein [Candidatus Gastranaerophilales bacterium]